MNKRPALGRFRRQSWNTARMPAICSTIRLALPRASFADRNWHLDGNATNQASGIDSCLAPAILTRIASSAESQRQTASLQESSEPQNNAVSPEEARIPKPCTLDSWHESQSTPLVVRCIGRLLDLLRVRRDAAFSCISDRGEVGVRSSSKCRKD